MLPIHAAWPTHAAQPILAGDTTPEALQTHADLRTREEQEVPDARVWVARPVSAEAQPVLQESEAAQPVLDALAGVARQESEAAQWVRLARVAAVLEVAEGMAALAPDREAPRAAPVAEAHSEVTPAATAPIARAAVAVGAWGEGLAAGAVAAVVAGAVEVAGEGGSAADRELDWGIFSATVNEIGKPI